MFFSIPRLPFLFFLFAASLLSNSQILRAEDRFPTFDEVDYVIAQDVSRFAALLQQGEKRVVRFALLGDSQETAPGGGGRVYMPRLNYELYKHFGNSPETLLEPIASTQYAWLLRSGHYAGGTVKLGERALPGVRIASLPKKQVASIFMLQHDGINLLPGTLLKGETSSCFRTDGVVKAEIFALTKAGSGRLRYEARPQDKPSPNYYIPTTTAGVLDIKLNCLPAEQNKIVSGKTPALDFAKKKYMQLHLSCEDEGKMVNVVAMRFINETHAHGVVVNDFSAGGYRLSNVLNSHDKSGDMYRAFGFDAAIIHLGANDTRDVTAVEFKKQTEQLITMIRGWMNDPDYKIILMGDPDLKTFSKDSLSRSEFNQYPGAQAAIAKADSNVLVINSRRIVDEKFHWRLGHKKLDDYLADQVHYKPEGGRVLAEAEMSVLLKLIPKRASK